jgi:3-oxoacyl-[acyl-carrier-protein] synthase-3
MYMAGFGKYLPSLELTNDDFACLLPTSDEWIRTRTGIRSRRVARPDEDILEGCLRAAKGALKASRLRVEELDAIVVATVTPPMAMPSLACLLAGKLGTNSIPAFDISAACSGFLYGLYVVRSMIRSSHRAILLLGADYFSWTLDYTDRSTCVLFGDGIGAAVLTNERHEGALNWEVAGVSIGSEGRHGGLLYRRHTYPNLSKGDLEDPFVRMNGQEVFRLAVTKLSEAAKDLLYAHGLKPKDIALVVPHQANIRILDAVSKKTGISMELFWTNLKSYGNTSAASIPIAMAELQELGNLKKKGLWMLSLACGSGLTWAAALMRS